MTAPTAQDDFEVWFLTGSQHLYGEETLRRVAEQSRGIAAMLSEAPAIRVKLVWKPVLVDHDAIRRTVLEANADDRVVGLVAWMHTFSPAKMWIAGLIALVEVHGDVGDVAGEAGPRAVGGDVHDLGGGGAVEVQRIHALSPSTVSLPSPGFQ